MNPAAIRRPWSATSVRFRPLFGPGGQNVNKTNTKAVARIALSDLEGLSDAERERIRNAWPAADGGRGIDRLGPGRAFPDANRGAALARLEAAILKAATGQGPPPHQTYQSVPGATAGGQAGPFRSEAGQGPSGFGLIAPRFRLCRSAAVPG
jgi:hypothetical protein